MGTKGIVRTRHLHGQPVRPVRYDGRHLGRGHLMAGMLPNGEIVLDETGRAVPFRQIGELR